MGGGRGLDGRLAGASGVEGRFLFFFTSFQPTTERLKFDFLCGRSSFQRCQISRHRHLITDSTLFDFPVV